MPSNFMDPDCRVDEEDVPSARPSCVTPSRWRVGERQDNPSKRQGECEKPVKSVVVPENEKACSCQRAKG